MITWRSHTDDAHKRVPMDSKGSLKLEDSSG